MTHPEFLLIDISNAFTKIACATRAALDRPRRVPTPELSARRVRALVKASGARRVVVASVVPAATARIAPALPAGTLHVGPAAAAGLRIEYPHPSSIGADRLANAVACIALFGKPSVVVDFGTAVTFDVISARGAYVGGVIAPGLNLMVDYLHSRTALLPHIRLAAPPRVVGKSTREAMLSGAVHGYRGLVAEILRRIRAEQFAGKKITVVATGGDAPLIAAALDLFDHSDPMLTLHGLRIIGSSHFPDRS